MKQERKKILILIFGLVILDQIIKIILLVSNFKLNIKGEFGIAIEDIEKSSDNLVYILISMLALILLFRYINSNNLYIKLSNKIIVSFAIAGIIGNMIDRIWKAYVITYINIPKFLSLNLSYIYIIITWIGLAVILTINTTNQIRIKKQKDEVNEKNKS